MTLETAQKEIARLRQALEDVRDFGHADGCPGYAPVYECGCYELSQRQIAENALAESQP